jgi:hypothetical protein
MKSKQTSDSTGAVASIAMLMLILGVLVIFTLQPPSLLESGSGMGNYRMPGSSRGGQGVTPPATTSGPGPGTTPSAGSTVTPTTAVVDFLILTNDTADNPL